VRREKQGEVGKAERGERQLKTTAVRKGLTKMQNGQGIAEERGGPGKKKKMRLKPERQCPRNRRVYQGRRPREEGYGEVGGSPDRGSGGWERIWMT